MIIPINEQAGSLDVAHTRAGDARETATEPERYGKLSGLRKCVRRSPPSSHFRRPCISVEIKIIFLAGQLPHIRGSVRPKLGVHRAPIRAAVLFVRATVGTIER